MWRGWGNERWLVASENPHMRRVFRTDSSGGVVLLLVGFFSVRCALSLASVGRSSRDPFARFRLPDGGRCT